MSTVTKLLQNGRATSEFNALTASHEFLSLYVYLNEKLESRSDICDVVSNLKDNKAAVYTTDTFPKGHAVLGHPSANHASPSSVNTQPMSDQRNTPTESVSGNLFTYSICRFTVRGCLLPTVEFNLDSRSEET